MELETELARLKSLFDKGLIDEAEYREEKKAVLSSSRPSGSIPPQPSGVPQGTAMSLVAGMTIGPDNKRLFRLEAKLGGGAMGEVWKAEDEAESKIVGHPVWVAVKALIPFLSAGERHREALKREAINAKKLSHAHIIRTHDWYEDKVDGFPFLVMEYLEGQTLDQKLAQAGHFTYAETLDILNPIVEALAYAWEEHRIVHRDLKPDNIYLTAEGKLKLLDFGIAAQVRNTASAVGLSGFDSPGTLGYAPPEAGANRKADPRSDIYSLGILSYELLEGQLPFNGLRQTTTPLPEKPEALNEAQWQVLRQAIAYDTQERPDSTEIYLTELRRAEGPSEEETERQRQAAIAEIFQRPGRPPVQAGQAAGSGRLSVPMGNEEIVKAAEAEKAKRKAEEETRQKAETEARQRAEEERKRQVAEAANREAARCGPLTTFRDSFADGKGQGPEMVRLPQGSFRMGGNAYDDEKPVHEVRIAYPLAVGKYPVTFEEWDRYAAEVTWAHQPGDSGWGRGRRPVINVNFHDAERYCAWLSKKTGHNYRLLSEAEWEYACRAGTATEYYWGDTEADIGKHAVFESNSNGKTAEVGGKRPNPWGLYDMSGNVWEWVEDSYHDSYKGAPADGSVWAGDGSVRVLRGGSWFSIPGSARAAARVRFDFSSFRSYDDGFRLARMLPYATAKSYFAELKQTEITSSNSAIASSGGRGYGLANISSRAGK